MRKADFLLVIIKRLIKLNIMVIAPKCVKFCYETCNGF